MFDVSAFLNEYIYCSRSIFCIHLKMDNTETHTHTKNIEIHFVKTCKNPEKQYKTAVFHVSVL